MGLTRRQALQLGLGTFAGVSAKSCTLPGVPQVQASPNINRSFKAAGTATLKQRAAAKGLLYGAAGSHPTLSQNADYASVFAQECGILVTENELKWTTVHPEPNRYDFTKSDWLMAFAQKHQMLFRGHTLVWNQEIPPWLEATLTQQNAAKIMTDHITTVMKRYAGRVHSWDVVNEAIVGAVSARADGLKESPWLTMLGTDYIEMAFRAAAAADPKAMLVYNDAYLDYDIKRDNRARTAVLTLLQFLKSRKVPVHALGIQAHLDGSQTQFNRDKFRQFLKDVASLGLKILITELDVADQDLPADIAVRDQRIAAAYEDYLSVVLDEPAVISVLTWGLSDRYSWLGNYAARKDGLPVRPLPFDRDLNRKLAWHGIAQALDAAPKQRQSNRHQA
jgi:endo-1,4-beta-xylanase